MARRSNVPKFGDWDNQGNVPYTVYFEKARKTRGNEKISAGPQEPAFQKEPERKATDMVRPSKAAPEPPSSAAYDQRQARARVTGDGNMAGLEGQRNWDAPRSNHEQRHVKEDGTQRRGNEPRFQDGKAKRRVSVDEGSMQHRNQQGRGGRGGGNGGSSRLSEGGGNMDQGSTGHGFSPLTPGRTRPKPVSYTSADLEYGSAVPEFGGWNEENPDSGENYTEKFNVLLKERHNGAVVAPSPAGFHRQPGAKSPKKRCGCFPWSKK